MSSLREADHGPETGVELAAIQESNASGSANETVEDPQGRSSLAEGTTQQRLHMAGNKKSEQPGGIDSWLRRLRNRPDDPAWRWELGGVFLSISSLAALLATLAYEDGELLTLWSGGISLNAIVSTLGAISRASLAFAVGSAVAQEKWNWYRHRPDEMVAFDRFEDATRGPWGGVRLLLWVRLRHWIVLGALATILLLGYEPFIQASLSLDGRLSWLNETNTRREDEAIVNNPDSNVLSESILGRSRRLDVGQMGFDAGLWDDGSGEEVPSLNQTVRARDLSTNADFGMISSFFSGLEDPRLAPKLDPLYTCGTGNCTWPIFASAAVCSACADVSEFIETTPWAERLNDKKIISGTTNSLPYMNFTLFDDQSLILGEDGLQQSAVSVAKFATRGIQSPAETLAFHELDTMLVTIAFMNTTDAFWRGEATGKATKVTATECALYFCAKVYQAAVTNGVFGEQMLGSWAIRTTGSWRFILDDGYMAELMKAREYTPELLEAWDAAQNSTLARLDRDFPRNDLQLQIPDTEASRYGLDDTASRFNISHNTIASTKRWLRSVTNQTQLLFSDFYAEGDTAAELSGVIVPLATSTNATALFERVGQSMTVWIRNLGISTPAAQVGGTQQWTLYYRVQWGYLAPPILCHVLGLSFFALVLRETRRLFLQPWKGSMVAILALGLDDGARQGLRVALRRGEMEQAARTTKVRFSNQGQGLELCEHGRQQ